MVRHFLFYKNILIARLFCLACVLRNDVNTDTNVICDLGQLLHAMTLEQSQHGFASSDHSISELSMQFQVRVQIPIVLLGQHVGQLLKLLLAQLVALFETLLGGFLCFGKVILSLELKFEFL